MEIKGGRTWGVRVGARSSLYGPQACPRGGLLAVKGGSPGTTEAYRGAVQAFIAWAKDHGRGLGTGNLAAHVAELREVGTGASTVNMALYAGKAALMQAAARAGMTARELAMLKTALDSVKGMKRPEPEVRVVTPEERRRLLEALEPEEGEDD